MTSSRYIAVIEESQVGFARRYVIEICQRISRDETFCGKAAIVVTEMARNLVRHGKGGDIVIREVATPASLSLELLALDRGPGMHNIAECLREFLHRRHCRYRFWRDQRLSDRFEVFSQPGRGTVVWVDCAL
jgi:anti-sigma regulatory factor (Ser/Thr protein kinase)